MRRQNRQYYWLKTQKKYRNLQKRLSSSTDEGLSKKLQGKLDRLGNRILSLNKKWRLGVATSILMAWMSAGTAQAQFTNPYDLSGLDGTNGFTINGISVNDQSGRAVSAAGDFNGDGINDLLIGAYGVNSYTGAAYVVFGSSGGFPSALELSTLNGSNGVIIEGENLGDETGKAISEAGDVNGDGIDDIIVSAVRADPGGRSGAGKIYVIFGSNSAIPATINVGTLDGNNGFVVNGITAGDEAGHSVAGGWDVNNDGISDMIVSSFKANSDTGEAYVVFGQSTPFASSLELSALDGNNGFTMQGIDPTDYLGHAVDLIEDFNNDGFNDIIISAPAGDGPANGVSGSGETYVVFGKATPFGSTLDLSTLDGNNGFTIYGVNVNDEAGYTVSGAGDINGDGFNDLLVGAPSATAPGYYGIVYVVFGSNLGFSASFDLNDMNGVNGFFINGENDYGGYAGFSVSAAGDINGDGVDDLLLGAIGGSANAYAGAGYVIFGKTTPFSTSMDLSSLNGLNGFKIPGLNDDDYSASVAGPGDINGDGIDDIFIGAAGGDPGGNSLAGESYVIFGIDISTPVVTKLTPADDATDVAPNLPLVISFDEDIQIGIGNITIRRSSDDGIIEVIDVTSAQANVGGSPVIPPYNLVIEPSSDLPNNENLYIEIDAGAILDLSANPFAGISGPTSWNFTTAPPIDPGAYLDASSLDGTNGFVINGFNVSEYWGEHVSNAGDLNADGIEDILVSSTTGSVGGMSFIIFGDNSGFPATLDLSSLDGTNGFALFSETPGDEFGVGTTLGDVNGDGIDDIIFGAPRNDANIILDAGGSYVIFGSSAPWPASFMVNTLDGTNGFKLNGIIAGDESGQNVAGIGDINSDGINDIAVSAPNADANGVDAGQVYVIFGKSSPFASSLDLSTLDGSEGFIVNGTTARESLGTSINGLGDINGDGIDDMIIGSEPESILYDWETGRAYVVFGEAGVSSIDLTNLDGTDGFNIVGDESNYNTHFNVAGAGDFNGDTFNDILIGDFGTNWGTGRAIILFGKNTAFPASLNLGSIDGSNGTIISGIDYGAGQSVSGAYDFNGDGFDDIIFGAYYTYENGYAGTGYIVFGKSGPFSKYLPLSELDQFKGIIVNGSDPYDEFGYSVSGLGDVNGDGLTDVIIGAPGADPGGVAEKGESYVIFGNLSFADVTVPLLSTFTPVDEATSVALATNLTMTFNESVQKGTGNLVIFDASDDSIVETIDVTSANVTTAGNTATINPVNDLPGGTTFYIQVAGTAFEDFSGNPFAGIADQTSWNFTTFLDVAVPLISTLSPVDESIDVLLDTDLSITFDEPIQKGTGNVTIFSSSDQSIVEAIDVTTANVVIAGNSATISPTNDLPANQRFYVQVDATAFEDLSSNAFLGITDTITWNFNSVVILNATPTVVLNGAGITSYSENAGSVTLAVDITITDDTPLMEGATITISGNFQTGEDELGFTDANGIAGVFDAATGILTLTGSAAPADYAAALATVRYRNTSENPSVLDRTIDYQVSDGFNFSTAISTTLSVSGVNDPPVLVSSGSPINYRSLTGEIIVDNTVTVTDVDHSSLVGAVASISSNFSSGEDVLHFVDQNGITGSFNAVSGVLTLAGSATLADYQLALRSITYENTINAPSAPTKAIDFQVSDPNDVSNVPTQTINVADNVVIADTFSEVVAVGDSIGWDILARAQFNPADNITISIVSAPALAEFEVIGSLFSYKPFIDVDGADEIVYELCNEFASCSTGTISLDVQNADPIINQEEPDRIAPKEDASILLTDYISDANGNLDLSTLEIISQPNKSNAFAEIDDQYFLKVDYSTTNFTGADRVTVGVCDLSGACIEEVIVIIVGELDMVNVFNAVSPNGDGLHDYLNIQDLEYFTSNAVFIYNRLGQLVYTMEAYENEIPGMRFEGFSDSGEDLPNGTYYWYVQMTSAEGKDYKQSGFFVLSK